MDQTAIKDAGTGPYTVTRTVCWGDCDPAGIIYTTKGLDYAVEVLEAWFRDVVGAPWITMNRELGLGAPTVHAEVDFLEPLHTDQEVVIRLWVESIGRASVTTRVTAQDADGHDYFRAKLVSCFVSKPAFKATAIPDAYRARIAAYREACDQWVGQS